LDCGRDLRSGRGRGLPIAVNSGPSLAGCEKVASGQGGAARACGTRRPSSCRRPLTLLSWGNQKVARALHSPSAKRRRDKGAPAVERIGDASNRKKLEL
jgi:hypothetical protein